MASAKKTYESFKRGSRRPGNIRTTYARSVSDNAARKRNDRLLEIIIDLLICVIIPPYGLYRLLTKETEIPVIKLAGTVIAGLMLFVWFSVLLPDEQPDAINITTVRPVAVEVYSAE